MINIQMPILEKNDTWETHREKLREEAGEVIDVIMNIESAPESASELLAETLDVMQVCIGIIEQLEKTNRKIILEGQIKHVEKLYKRGWKFKKMIIIRED